MGPETTVMTKQQVRTLPIQGSASATDMLLRVAKHQAEITWPLAFNEGAKRAIELIEEGRDLCRLASKDECSKCLSQLLSELNTL